MEDIRVIEQELDNLKQYVNLAETGAYNDKHCAMMYMMNLECDICPLLFVKYQCMSSNMFHVMK
jgi:hypothetical protein